MTKDFNEAMSQRTDKQLAEILAIHRIDYQASAVEAAEIEFKKRGLDISNFLSEADIIKAKEKQQPVDLEKENLHWYFKILTLGIPNLFYVIFKAIYQNSPEMIFAFIPVSILVQFLIHYILQQKGFYKIATDFKKWSYYSWAIKILFLVLGLIGST